MRLFFLLALGLLACRSQAGAPTQAPLDNGLRPAAAFADIADRGERSRAVFGEAARVFAHPRCANCHPADARPRQGDDSLAHVPPVWGGPEGRGVPALECVSCHHQQNYEALEMPGAPGWHLAPPEMVFLGASAAAICEAMVANAARGGMQLGAIADHVEHDALVAWGYAPGPSRRAPPGSATTLAGLVRAWVATGAACPIEETPK